MTPTSVLFSMFWLFNLLSWRYIHTPKDTNCIVNITYLFWPFLWTLQNLHAMLCSMHSSRSLLEMSKVFLNHMPEKWFHYPPERDNVSQTCLYIQCGASNILFVTQSSFHIIAELSVKDDLWTILFCKCSHIQIKNETLKKLQTTLIRVCNLELTGSWLLHSTSFQFHFTLCNPTFDCIQPETLIMLTLKQPLLTWAIAWI
jgi:hypothetical protein